MKGKNTLQPSAVPENKPFRYSVYFIIFGATAVSGAYFAPWMIILNIFFLLLLIFRKTAIKLDLNAAFLTGLLIAAVLSSVIVGGSPGIAVEELLKYLLFPVSYIVFLNIEDKKMVEAVFYHSFIFLAVGGLMAMAGLPLISDMVIEESGRLQSFIQYANTTAMLLSVGVLMSVNYFIVLKKKIHIIYGAVMLAALILTQSRIGILVFVAVTALYVFTRIKQKRKYYIAAALGAAAVGAAVVGHRIVMNFIFEPTLVERYITYLDAISELRSNFFGIGMGMWQFEHVQFQSAPYQVKYIHSVYFQIAMDCGVLGLLCFLAAAIKAAIAGIKEKGIYLFMLLLLAAGSIFEVNFAFGIVIIFFTFVLSNLSPKLKEFNVRKAALLPLTTPILALTILLFSEAAVFLGRQSSGNPERAMGAYNVALHLNPLNYRIYMDMAKLETSPHKSLELLELGFSKNPVDRHFMAELVEGYKFVGDRARTLEYARLLYKQYRYRIETEQSYEAALQDAYEAGLISREDFHFELTLFHAEVRDARGAMNPLYRYIRPHIESRN